MYFGANEIFLVKFTVFIALIQGTTWLTLSITGIIARAQLSDAQLPVDYNNTIESKTYIQYLSDIIYNRFIYGDANGNTLTISANDFQIFLWIYTMMSALWIIVSVDLYAAIRRQRKQQIYLALSLGVSILIVSIIDGILTTILAKDFYNCPAYPTESSISENSLSIPLTSTLLFECQLAVGIIMSIVARGYTLWFLNVGCSIWLIVIGYRILRSLKVNKSFVVAIPRPRWIMETKKTNRKRPNPIDDKMNTFESYFNRYINSTNVNRWQ